MIRKYRPEDANHIVAVWRHASVLAHPFLEKSFLDAEAANVRDVYLAFAETYVTEIEGEVIGFVALIDHQIGGLFLSPDFHGRGLGRAMVDRAVAEKGKLTVEVFTENRIGRRFYEGYGFRETGKGVFEPTNDPILILEFDPG